MNAPVSRMKNHRREKQLYTQRAWVCFGAICLGFGLVVMQLFRLQWLEHDRFLTLAHNNRMSIHPLDPQRGLIFDRRGRLLAENIPEYALHIRPDRVKNLEDTLQRLAQIIPISEAERKNFKKNWQFKRRFLGIPLKNRLDEVTVARFAVHRHRFPEVELNAHLVRHYPYGDLLAHVVGYVGRINADELGQVDASNYSASAYIGKTGIEKYYESRLHGQVGFQAVETDAKGRIIRILSEDLPKPGDDLHLSLDIDYQKRTADLLQGMRGAMVVMEPQTGAVLALVSSPSFDPNPFVEGIENRLYNALLADPKRPLYNRVLRGLYAPASTVKPFLALYALHENMVDPQTRIYDPGWYQLKGDSRQYRDWKKHGHGWVNLADAIVASCDTYFYQLAVRLGIDRIAESFRHFGLGQETGIDLPGEKKGVVPNKAWKWAERQEPWYPGETLSHGIGQGFTLVTPMQMAVAASTLANRGYRPIPHVVHPGAAPHGGSPGTEPGVTLPGGTPLPYAPALFEWTAEALQRVFSDPMGTGYKYAPAHRKYTLAGKSGTAQVFTLKQNERYNAEGLAERLRDHSWFIGYAPADKPQIAIAVILENQTGSPGVARAFCDTFFGASAQESKHVDHPQNTPHRLVSRHQG